MTDRGETTASRHPVSRIAMLLTLGAAVTSTWTGFRVNGLNIGDYFLVSAAAFWILALLLLHRPLRFPGWSTAPVAALALFAAVGAVAGDVPLLGQRNVSMWVVGEAAADAYAGPLLLIARMFLALTLVTFVVTSSAKDNAAHSRMILLMYALGLGAAISALDAVLQQTAGFPDLPFQYHILSNRASGFANHPNSLGQSLALAIPVILHAALRSARAIARVSWVFGLALVSFGVYLSGSRAALIMSFIVLIAGCIIAMRGTRWTLLALPLAPLSVAIGMVLTPPLLAGTRFADTDANESTSARLAALKAGWGMFLDAPVFGSGVASWVGEMVPLILLTSGGVALFVIFYWCLSFPLLRGFRAPGSANSLTPALLLMGAATLAFGILNNSISERYLYWPFAALYALSQLEPRAHPYPARRARRQTAASSTLIAAHEPSTSAASPAHAP